MKKVFAVMAVAGFAASALAQNSGARLIDGNALYDVTSAGATGTIPTTSEPTGTAAGAQANLRPSGAPGTTGQDQLYANWWWYRVNGASTRELGVRQTTGTAVKSSLGSNHVAYQITPATGLTFTMNYWLTDLDGAGGNNAANILTSMTVTNTTGAAADISLFNMVDLFLFGGDAGDRLRTATVGGNGDRSLLVSDSTVAAAAATMMFTGYGATGYGIGTFSGISGQMSDTGLDNFADVNSGAPVEPTAGADISAVMQWNLGLVPDGGSRTVWSAVAVDLGGTAQTVPTPGALALVGMGGLIASRRRRA
ncbi:MAG TPA: hypothetical protein VHN77_05025 [Phycisphaerales bacterium]|nr:hypothetical protein [Phycisphaerales bacterium]